jgi:O-acetylserine/cysteine efflux transporter
VLSHNCIHDKFCIVPWLSKSYRSFMRPLHILLGILVAAIWGFNFVVLKVALVDVPPMLLTALRFLFSCLPVFFFAKPAGMKLGDMIAVGLCTFLGQYIFLFVAMKMGMPAGLSSITLQLQVFITIGLSIVLLGETLKRRQVFGSLLAFLGLGTIAATVGQGTSIPLIAMLFMVLAAATWAYGNITIRRAGPAAQFGSLTGVAWASLVPIVPAFALSLVFEGPASWVTTWQNLHPITVAALAFTVVFSTWVGFSIWSKLLASYPAGTAAPFALLVPVFGALSGYVFLGEIFSAQRGVGALMIFAGLAIILLPLEKMLARPAT